MKYVDLCIKSNSTFEKAINYLIKNALSSLWSDNGIGWHEQWLSADKSGIYASCEGCILLKLTYDNNKQSIIKSAYCDNLSIAFDARKPIRDDENYFHKTMQRNKALHSSFKLSRFLYASSYMDQDLIDEELVIEIENSIKKLYDKELGEFYCALGNTKTSKLATAISFNSLKNSVNWDLDEKEKTKENIKGYVKNLLLTNNENDISIGLIGLWALSDSISSFSTISKMEMKESIDGFIRDRKKYTQIYTEKYVLSRLGMRDSYSVNTKLFFILAIINMINDGFLEFSYISYVVEEIMEIENIVNENSFYCDSGIVERVLFWENFYALLVLKSYTKLGNIFETQMEEKFMIITPKYFSDVNAIEQEDLAVVIMPYSTEWSDSVYELFKIGAKKFVVWRSKEECLADVIMQTLWDYINRAKFIIADCTGKNPNVFYELGIAHTIGKPVFVCSQNRTDLPFDINYIRTYEYDLSDKGKLKLVTDLETFIKNL